MPLRKEKLPSQMRALLITGGRERPLHTPVVLAGATALFAVLPRRA